MSSSLRRVTLVLLAAGCGDDASSTTAGAGGAPTSTARATTSVASAATQAASATSASASTSGTAGATLRVAVISDLNDAYGATTYGDTVHDAVDALVDTVQPDLVLVTGDMVAGQQAGLDYRAMWAGFHDAVTSPLRTAGIPLAITPGNHDASGYATFAGEREIFVDEWSDPTRVPAVEMIDDTNYPLRYSFAFKGAFFLSLDATTVGPVSGEQRDWAAAQLEAAAAYPVKIAYGHVPLHAVAIGREDETLGDDDLEAIFREHGLTAYVSGHHHAYYPGARDGLRLVSTACLGSGPRPLIGTGDPSPRAILQIDVEDGVVTSLEALRAPELVSIIDRSTLPEALSYEGRSVRRDDLAGF